MVVVSVKSIKSTRGGKVTYDVKLAKVCKAKNSVSDKLHSGKTISLSVRQEVNGKSSCLCPKLVEGKDYRMAVNLGATSSKIWEIELPKLYCIKQTRTC